MRNRSTCTSLRKTFYLDKEEFRIEILLSSTITCSYRFWFDVHEYDLKCIGHSDKMTLMAIVIRQLYQKYFSYKIFMLKKIPWHWFQRFMLLLPFSALWVWAYWKISSTGRWFLWQQFTMNDLRRFNTCWKTERWQKKIYFRFCQAIVCCCECPCSEGTLFWGGRCCSFSYGGRSAAHKKECFSDKECAFWCPTIHEKGIIMCPL